MSSREPSWPKSAHRHSIERKARVLAMRLRDQEGDLLESLEAMSKYLTWLQLPATDPGVEAIRTLRERTQEFPYGAARAEWEPSALAARDAKLRAIEPELWRAASQAGAHLERVIPV